jgi:predicted nucleic acid-binding Zn ribbon protein
LKSRVRERRKADRRRERQGCIVFGCVTAVMVAAVWLAILIFGFYEYM